MTWILILSVVLGIGVAGVVFVAWRIVRSGRCLMDALAEMERDQ